MSFSSVLVPMRALKVPSVRRGHAWRTAGERTLLCLFVYSTVGSAYTRDPDIPYANGGAGLSCWKNKLMTSCKADYPGVDMEVEYGEFLGSPREDNLVFLGDYGITVTVSPGVSNYTGNTSHASRLSTRMCNFRIGFCSPFHANDDVNYFSSTPVTARIGMPTRMGISLPEGDWTLIVNLYVVDHTQAVHSNFVKGVSLVVRHKPEPMPEDAFYSMALPMVLGVIRTIHISVFISLIWMKKRTKILRISSWKLCMMTAFGGLMVNSSLFAFYRTSVEPNHITKSSPVCYIRLYLLAVGLDILLMPLILKTWRLHKLFNSGVLRRIAITDQKLFRLLMAVTIVDIVVVTLYFVLTDAGQLIPMYPQNFDQLQHKQQHFFYECGGEEGEKSRIFIWIIVLLKVPQILASCYLAWNVRTFITELNESGQTFLAVFNFLIVSVFVGTVQALLRDYRDHRQLLRCLGTFVIANGTISIMLMPKFYRLFKEGDMRSISYVVQQESSRSAARLKKIEENKALQGSTSSPAAQSLSQFFTKGNLKSGPTFKSYMPRTIPVLEIPNVNTADQDSDDDNDGFSNKVVAPVSVKLESRGTYILDEF